MKAIQIPGLQQMAVVDLPKPEAKAEIGRAHV